MNELLGSDAARVAHLGSGFAARPELKYDFPGQSMKTEGK